MTSTWQRVFWGMLSWACSLTVSAHAAAPTLTRLFPAGAQRGTATTVTCTGEFAWPVHVDAPGLIVECQTTKGELRVTVPPDLMTDRTWIRLYATDGASARLPFLIGSVAESNAVEPNDTLAQANDCATFPLTVNGVLERNGDVDTFAVQIERGQTLVAAVDAHRRLGSPMDAVLQLVSPRGAVVAENHDDQELDARLAYTATESGRYFVRLFAFAAEPDTYIGFRGNDAYVYRLTVTTGPFLTQASPLAAGPDAPVSAQGWNMLSRPPLSWIPAERLLTDQGRPFGERIVFGDLRDARPLQLAALGPADLPGNARLWTGVDAAQPLDATSPGAASDETQPLTVPAFVSGCIDRSGHVDRYRFAVSQGETLSIAVESVSLDTLLVPLVKITNAAGTTLAEFPESSPTADAVLSLTAAEAGDVVVSVTDRYGTGSVRHAYLLSVWRPLADFTLSADQDAYVTSATAPVDVNVAIKRLAGADGTPGPIRVAALDLPPGVTCDPVISTPGEATAEKVTLKLVGGAAAFQGPWRLVGEATTPRPVTRPVTSPPALGASLPTVWLTVIGSPEPTSPAVAAPEEASAPPDKSTLP